MNYIVFGEPLIDADEISEVVKCLKSGWIGTGPKVAQFENEFKHYKRCEYAVALSSCSAALHLSILASGIGRGDEVITSAMTFCSTVNSIIHAGATPVIVDCDPTTGCIDPKEVEKKINKKTKALIPVHFAGKACDMDSLSEIASQHGLIIIEDCAHAIESVYHGRTLGTIGQFGCFSFYVTKNLVTAEGGMVLTRDQADAEKIKRLALHGLSADAWKRFSDVGYKHYQVVELGFKYNMTDIQAALGIHQLRRLEKNWIKRKQYWEKYHLSLQDLPLEFFLNAPEDEKHAYHLFPLLINENRADITRDRMIKELHNRKIGVGVHYLSIPSHSYYKKTFGWNPEEYPNSNIISQQTLSLPLSARLSEQDIDYVIAAIRGIIKQN